HKVPNFPGAHSSVGAAYAAKGMREEAATEFQKGAGLLPPSPDKLWYAGQAQALSGLMTEADGTIAELQALSGQRYVSSIYVAYIHARLGRTEETLEWLERAYADHSFFLVYLKVNPIWDPLRSDPRFADLLRRMHLAS